jgi:MinD-like ATPase involved in chromosome partitioning or flagellar assembly
MRNDQAFGLRRLFVPRRARMLGVVGAEATGVVLELAAAFAQLGQRVLLLDRSCGDAARGFGLVARFELRHALARDKALADVALEGPHGIVVLPCARALADADAAGPLAADRLREHLDHALGPFDVMLVNGAPLPVADAQVLLALAPTSAAVTQAYTELKTLARGGRARRCELVVHGARTEGAALDAFDSVAITAGRFLGMTLALAGTMPGTPRAPGHGPQSPRSRAATRIAQRLAADAPARPAHH